MEYREFAATPALALIVDCVWTLDGHAREMADAQPVLPDGRPEIVTCTRRWIAFATPVVSSRWMLSPPTLV